MLSNIIARSANSLIRGQPSISVQPAKASVAMPAMLEVRLINWGQRALVLLVEMLVILSLALYSASSIASTSAVQTRLPVSVGEVVNPAQLDGPSNELHIARLVFAHGPHSNWGPGTPWWRIDWPSAEHFFTQGLKRYTSIDAAADSVHVSLLDETVYDYPWLFAQQVGRWQLGHEEVAALREYLLRGGFLVVDDFHGPDQWRIFESVMQRALPEAEFDELSSTDALMNVLYELDHRTQIPGRRHLRAGRDGQVQVDMPFSPARWRGIHDEQGRLMVAVNFNMDMGDAWEHADDPMYPVPMTSLAYRFGINYVVYALTH